MRNREHAQRVVAHLGAQPAKCDGCEKAFARSELTAVGAGLFLVCGGCVVPPYDAPTGDDADEDEREPGRYHGDSYEE